MAKKKRKKAYKLPAGDYVAHVQRVVVRRGVVSLHMKLVNKKRGEYV